MAISGTFLADFKSFEAAVSKAEVSLKSFEGGAGKVATSLDRATNAFSGVKIVQQATIAAEAVERIGGISKLTEKELARVGATATEAAAKLTAMGQTVPPGIQKIVDAATKIEPPLTLGQKAASLLQSTFAQFTLAGLATKAITEITGKVREFIATGVKLPAIQESFTKLATSMGQDSKAMLGHLRKGTDGLVSDFALMQSANKAMLLGLPVTSEAMGELAHTARVLGKAMGQDATKSLEDLIVALGRSSPMILDNLGLTVKVGEANEAYAEKLGKTVEQLTDAEKKMAFYEAAMAAARRKTEELGEQTKTLGQIMDSVWIRVGNVVSEAAGIVNSQVGKILTQKDALVTFLKLMAVAGSPGAALQAMQDFDIAKAASQKKGTDIVLPATPEQEFAGLMKAATDLREKAFAPLTEAQSKLTREFMAGKSTAKEITEELNKYRSTSGVTEKQIQSFMESMRGSSKAGNEYAETLKRMAAARLPLTQAQIAQIDLWVKEEQKVGDMAKALHVSEVAVSSYIKSNQEYAKNLKIASTATVGLSGDLKNYGTQVQISDGLTTNMISTLKVLEVTGNTTLPGVKLRMMELPPEIKKAADEIERLKKVAEASLRSLSGAFSDLSRVSSGSLSQITGNLSTVTSALDAGKRAAKDFQDGLSLFKQGDTLAGIAGMATGIMGIVSAAIAAAKAIKAIWSAFDRNKGRDLVVDFAESFGGFDALHAQLGMLGDAGEALWIKLTQGVGRNNPEQAARVIAEVEAALDKQREAQEDAIVTSEEGAQATIESAAQAAIALDQLNARLEMNREAWAAWSADVTGYLQKLANDIRAMPLPGPTGLVQGSGTGLLSGGLGSNVLSGGTQVINNYLDGEVLTRVVVRGAPRELNLIGAGR